jgi:hypothetical protein
MEERRAYLQQAKGRNRVEATFCRIEERKKGGCIFNRLKEGIKEWRPSAE